MSSAADDAPRRRPPRCRRRARRSPPARRPRALAEAEDVGAAQRVAGDGLEHRAGRARARRRPAGRRATRGSRSSWTMNSCAGVPLPEQRAQHVGRAPSGSRRCRSATTRRPARPRSTSRRPRRTSSAQRQRRDATVRRRRGGRSWRTGPGALTAGPILRAAYETDEDRAAESAVTMPTWSSPGRASTRPMTSAPSSSTGDEHRAVRQDPAQVGAGEGADEVRHHQPDEDDRPAGGGRGPAQQGDGDASTSDPGAAGSGAERPRGVVAERQGVQRPGGSRARRSSPTSEERQHLGRRSRCPREASEPTVQNRSRSSAAVSSSITALT